MYNDDYNLKICVNDKKKEIFIPQKSCFLNTLVLGNKGTGKSSLILKELAYQTINNRNVGATFIVSSKDLSYELYILAKHYKRRVVFINPSVSNEVDLILSKDNIANSDLLKLYNFEKYIYNNYIVIIDIENIKTSKKGINLVECLLENFKDSMCKTDITCSRPHFLYIDDAFYYIESLKDILYYGNEYNIASTLFFQNRNQFKTKNKDYSSFLDSNIGNIILTNNLTYEDAKYYGEVLDINLSAFCKSRGKIFYEFKNKEGARFSGNGEVKETKEFNEIVYEELYSVKRALKRKKIKEQNKNIIDSSKKDNSVSKVDTNIKDNSVEIKTNDELAKNLVEDNSLKTETTNSNKETNKVDFNMNSQEKQNSQLDTSKNESTSEKSNSTIFEDNIFDDGKIELTFDWDDYDF